MTDQERNLFKESQEELRLLITSSEDKFDKQISYIASGGLALTFVLIEKVVGNVYESRCLWILFGGWLTLAACLLVNLWSQRIAADVHRANKAEIDAALTLSSGADWHDGCYNQKRCEARRSRIEVWNRFSIWSLFLGIFFILLFTIINLIVHKSASLSTEILLKFDSTKKTMSSSNNQFPKPANTDTATRGSVGSNLPQDPKPNAGSTGSSLPAMPVKTTPTKGN